jgi:AraC family transcriptional regulator
MLIDVGDVSSAQGDGTPPSVLVAGAASGESGVSIMTLNYQGSTHFTAKLRKHMIAFISQGPVTCRLAGKTLSHDARDFSLGIFPAGLDTACDRDSAMTSLLVAIDPSRLALAAAEDCALDAELIGRMAGFDASLLSLAQSLSSECAGNFPRGSVFWNETASRFIAAVVSRHTSGPKPESGIVDAAMLRRIRDYLMERLDEPIDVATLASMAGRSQLHFSRVFHRAVGVSPYQYIIYLRIRRAVQLIQEARLTLAEIAACTGFADQSHLSRWVRRVYGVSPSQLVS